MGYTTKVLARKRAAGYAEWFLGHCGPERPSQFPIWRFHCHAPASCSLCLATVQVSSGFRWVRIVRGDRRIQGGREGEALGQKNVDAVGPSLVPVVMRGGRPPRE